MKIEENSKADNPFIFKIQIAFCCWKKMTRSSFLINKRYKEVLLKGALYIMRIKNLALPLENKDGTYKHCGTQKFERH